LFGESDVARRKTCDRSRRFRLTDAVRHPVAKRLPFRAHVFELTYG
jgi:hypothetical protein